MNSWFFFALLAPFLWGFTNVIDGALRRHFVKSDMALTWWVAITRLPFVIFFFVIAGIEIPNALVIVFMFLGGILWILPLVLYYKVMEFEEPSRVVLLMQLVPLFTLLIAFFALQERLTPGQIVAFALLIGGGGIASLKRLEGVWHFSKAFLLMILATFFWASSDVIFKKFEPAFSTFLAAFAFYFLGSFLTSMIMIAHPHGRKNILKHFTKLPARAWWLLVIVQVVGISGSISFAYALTLGKASLTAVLIGIQPLFVLGFGMLLSLFIREIRKEDLSKQALLLKGISFALILIGLVFLEF